MAPLIAIILLLCYILPLVTAGWIKETWTITSLTTHFMGKNSGLADGRWPPNSGFPSTATFVLRQSFERGPAVGGIFKESADVIHNDVNCGATWMPDSLQLGGDGEGVMPTNWTTCAEWGNGSLGMRFRFGGADGGSGSAANPTGFLLDVGRDGFNGSWKVPYVTDVNVPATGNITNPYGWLICAGGAPLSGVHCHLEGQITKYGYTDLKPAIAISNVTSPVASFDRRYTPLMKISPISVSTLDMGSGNCSNEIQFNIGEIYCATTWPCSITLNEKGTHYCSNMKYAFTLSSTQFVPGTNDLFMSSLHIDVTNTTCVDNRVMKTRTAGMDMELPAARSRCDEKDCRWWIGELWLEMPVEKEDIVGDCVPSEDVVMEVQ